MSTALKDVYTTSFYKILSQAFQPLLPNWDEKKFLKSIVTPAFEQMELKQRMSHTVWAIHQFLPKDVKKAVPILLSSIENLKKVKQPEDTFYYMFFPEYISTYGLDDLPTSLTALEKMTQFASAEFAIRPFILKYEKEVLSKLLEWSTHKNYKVRRLSSEGSRPRLPWAMALPKFKKDPRALVPILENLKADENEIVRRSVANHLNDISKDNPDVFLSIIKKWKGKNKETDALLKHASRTLLKAGHPEILTIYGLKSDSIVVEKFDVHSPMVKLGNPLHFSCRITNTSKKTLPIRLEYKIYFKKANGTLAGKVFKISEREYPPQFSADIDKKHTIKFITTRQYYKGTHEVAIVVNGKVGEKQPFELIL
ncbi:MAG: DNA alkylation repair protein [Cytophagaceae bacterium]|jgi:3-methyladenine DNA glycosylase AlkC|nr:DNA alkylation repair protein [Cytophagaceae bacterium]